MRVLLGHHGLRGDICLNLPAIRYLHDQFGWEIDLPINRRFADMAPLFFNQSYVNSVVITDGYDDFPTKRDEETLQGRGYDRIFHPMQAHLVDKWYETMHQTEVVLADYMALRLPAEYKQIRLDKWFEVGKEDRVVAMAPFAGYDSNPDNNKRLSVERAQEIVAHVKKRGFEVFQLGGPTEPRLDGVQLKYGSYFDSMRSMLGCKALIHTDTGAAWVASAYQLPQLGLYGHRYYGKEHVSNIQPVNPNAVYLDAPTVAEIPFDQIASAIDKMILA